MTIRLIDEGRTVEMPADDDTAKLYIDDWSDDVVLVTIDRKGFPLQAGVRIALDDLIEAAAHFVG